MFFLIQLVPFFLQNKNLDWALLKVMKSSKNNFYEKVFSENLLNNEDVKCFYQDRV